jgi:prepilin-type N-terminal cleavage/methylation domain-containing protein
MRKLTNLLRSSKGFTLAEMVIVIMVLAVLVTMSTPAIYQFLRQRDRQNEENVQLEIRKALQAYLADKNVLPSPATWSADLAGYTNLSTDQIANDTWNRPRSFITYTDPFRNLQGTNVEIFYATLMSAGPNGNADTSPGVAVDSEAFADSTHTDWWSNATGTPGPVASFSALRTGGDDLMTRFTDYPEKLERYNVTVQRLERISSAIESYAKNGYANKVVQCGGLARDPATGLTGDTSCDNGAPERMIYYPKSLAVTNATDTANYYNSTVYVDNAQSDSGRRTSVQGLMRLLGLPDDFCCSALSLGGDGSPKPFYYFSNPRPRNAGGGCGARPDANTIKLPARITTTNDDSAAVNPTCG